MIFFLNFFYLESFLWPRRKQFWQPFQLVSTDGKNLPLYVQKSEKSHFSQQKKAIRLKVFLWTCRLHFWQTSSKQFRQTADIFLLHYRKSWKKNLLQKVWFFSNSSQEQVDTDLWKLARKILTKSQTLYSQLFKMTKKLFIKVFRVQKSSKMSYGHVECIFDNATG